MSLPRQPFVPGDLVFHKTLYPGRIITIVALLKAPGWFEVSVKYDDGSFRRIPARSEELRHPNAIEKLLYL